jgi:Holliday junction resolvase
MIYLLLKILNSTVVLIMTGKKSKRKGARGELELAKALKGLGFDNARRGRQYAGGPDSPDVHGILGVHIECKRMEKFSLYPALEQSINDAGNNVPTVMYRKNYKDWVVIVRLKDLEELSKRITDGLQ